MKPKNRKPAHPGEILQRLFLDDMEISQTLLAHHIGCKPGKINEIVKGRRGVTAATALSLSGALKTSPEFWLDLQTAYDLWGAKQEHSKVEPISA